LRYVLLRWVPLRRGPTGLLLRRGRWVPLRRRRKFRYHDGGSLCTRVEFKSLDAAESRLEDLVMWKLATDDEVMVGVRHCFDRIACQAVSGTACVGMGTCWLEIKVILQIMGTIAQLRFSLRLVWHNLKALGRTRGVDAAFHLHHWRRCPKAMKWLAVCVFPISDVQRPTQG